MKKEVQTTHVFNQADQSQSGNWLLAAALRRPSCCLATFNLLAYVNPYMLTSYFRVFLPNAVYVCVSCFRRDGVCVCS